MKILPILLILAGALAFNSRALAAERAVDQVILIGWDGADRGEIETLMAQNRLPHLKRLSAQGAYVPLDIQHYTETKPGFTQILTGYTPEKTGVYRNDLYQPVPEGFTILERLEVLMGADGIATAMLLENKHNFSASRHGLFYHTFRNVDVFNNKLRGSKAVARAVLKQIDQFAERPFLIFTVFIGADSAGHRHGGGSVKYQKALMEQDFWLGKIMERLELLGKVAHPIIYVTADHGFPLRSISHAAAPNIFLVTNDPLAAEAGDQADIAPTVLKRFGFDPENVVPEMDGSPLK